MLLNLDAGEHPEEPDELWDLADILCVACGGHAGDTASMDRVVRFVAAHPHIALGAHPSYPDRAHFGRMTPPTFDPASLEEQCRALAEVAAQHGVAVRYIKPHGALYHDAARDPVLAAVVAQIGRDVFGPDVVLITPGTVSTFSTKHDSSGVSKPGTVSTFSTERGSSGVSKPGTVSTFSTELDSSGVSGGLRKLKPSPVLREGFADRAVRADGSLVPRGEPGALITDPAAAAARARELVASGSVDTICCHADTPGSLAIVRAVRSVLT